MPLINVSARKENENKRKSPSYSGPYSKKAKNNYDWIRDRRWTDGRVGLEASAENHGEPMRKTVILPVRSKIMLHGRLVKYSN